jgi:uncharacterized membrane protein YphA (DoxX/SURF4 family)
MRTWSDCSKSRLLRLLLAPWLLLGHGIPKLATWWLGLATWGPHIAYTPKNFMSGVTACVEFLAPLLILLGFQVRIAAGLLFALLAFSAFALPFPWLHLRVPVTGYDIPFAIIPSKEMALAYAFAYLGLALFGRDETFWKKSKSPI